MRFNKRGDQLDRSFFIYTVYFNQLPKKDKIPEIVIENIVMVIKKFS